MFLGEVGRLVGAEGGRCGLEGWGEKDERWRVLSWGKKGKKKKE
jgi:hypothetical protein